jgi:valyl-tRNA synthetase
LLHPVVPFISETLWQRLPGHEADTFLAAARWPAVRAKVDAYGAEFEVVRSAVGALRQVRSDYALPPAKLVDAVVVPGGAAARAVLLEEAPLVGRLTRAVVQVADAAPAAASAQAVVADGTELFVPLAGLVDVEKECAKVRTDLEALARQLSALRGRLANEGFVTRAKPEVVEAERTKEREWSAREEQLARKLAQLCG